MQNRVDIFGRFITSNFLASFANLKIFSGKDVKIAIQVCF